MGEAGKSSGKFLVLRFPCTPMAFWIAPSSVCRCIRRNVTIANLAVGLALPPAAIGGVVQEVRDSTDLQSMGISIEEELGLSQWTGSLEWAARL